MADGAVQHRAAPHQRRLRVDQEADGDQLHAVGHDGFNALAVARERASVGNAHHQGHVGAVDVRVQQADRRAHLSERDGEVDGHRALADPTLAAADGDRVAHPDVDLAGQAIVPRHLRIPHNRDLRDAGHGLVDRALAILLDHVLERAGGGGEDDGKADVATVDRYVTDHVEGDEVSMELRIVDGRERRDDLGFGDARLPRSVAVVALLPSEHVFASPMKDSPGHACARSAGHPRPGGAGRRMPRGQ